MTAETGTPAQIRERLRQAEEEARQLGHEVADITGELRQLAAEEVQLGVAEVKEQVGFALKGGMLMLAGLIVAEFILVFLGLAAMFAIDTVLQAWAAALITAAGFLILSGLLLLLGRMFLKKLTWKPQKLMNSLGEDAKWARSLLSSNKA